MRKSSHGSYRTRAGCTTTPPHGDPIGTLRYALERCLLAPPVDEAGVGSRPCFDVSPRPPVLPVAGCTAGPEEHVWGQLDVRTQGEWCEETDTTLTREQG
ncbi:MAG: hypothetical protein V3R80_04735 [Candidatus Tectomicrobia bacterium]